MAFTLDELHYPAEIKEEEFEIASSTLDGYKPLGGGAK
jgi:hypothetical protein